VRNFGELSLDIEKLRILIVGAGIAGLALSIALRRRGCSALVIERNAEWSDAGTGIYLPGNALRALSVLQVDADVRAHGAPIETQRFCDHRGRLLNEIDVVSIWRSAGPCLAVHRADLHGALRKATDASRVRMGVTLNAISQASDSAAVRLSDGTVGQYDLVVGADGIGSAARQLAFNAAGLRALKQSSWRFVIPCPSQITTWSVLMHRVSACLMMPIGRERAYCYVDSISDQASTNSTNRLQEVLSQFAGPAESIRRALADDIAIHAAQIEEVVLDNWSRGRVVLVGDAAHAMSPNMAQGAAMAIEDALVLADCLSTAHNIESAISAYEARRIPRVNRVLAMTHRRDRIRQLHPVLRNAVLRTFGHHVYRSHYGHLLTEP
jgi:FAD-dependent urate hydroxylase